MDEEAWFHVVESIARDLIRNIEARESQFPPTLIFDDQLSGSHLRFKAFKEIIKFGIQPVRVPEAAKYQFIPSP